MIPAACNTPAQVNAGFRPQARNGPRGGTGAVTGNGGTPPFPSSAGRLPISPDVTPQPLTGLVEFWRVIVPSGGSIAATEDERPIRTGAIHLASVRVPDVRIPEASGPTEGAHPPGRHRELTAMTS